MKSATLAYHTARDPETTWYFLGSTDQQLRQHQVTNLCLYNLIRLDQDYLSLF